MSFCAICARDQGPLVERQLGPGEPRVKICKPCDTETPREGHGVERAYEPTGSTLDLYKAVTIAVRKLLPAKERLAKHQDRLVRKQQMTPGYILVRIRKRGHGGKTRDRHEAQRLLDHEPWAKDLRYLGNDAIYHLFERPDERAAAKQQQSDDDPLAAIRKFQVV